MLVNVVVRNFDEMILTYKYRIKDNSARKTLARHAYAVNQVWNYCNAVQKDMETRYRAGAPKRKWLSHFDFDSRTKDVSKELGIHAQTISCVCQQYAISRDRARRSVRFRSSGGSRRSLGWILFQKQSRQVVGNTITYRGKRYRFWEGSRPFPTNAKSGCFVEDSRGRWYVCFYVEKKDRIYPTTQQIGIDLGLKSLAVCSDGAVIQAPQIYRRYEQQLAIAQRAGNRSRAKAVHAKIKNSRKDFLHKVTTKIVRENALIAVGNVCSSKLAKTRMAKSVYDVSWSMFRSQLRYKASRHGAVYMNVDEAFTTQTCSSCGALPLGRPEGIAGLGIREWECSECGASHDRDVNAAKNILVLALSAQRPVEGSLLARAG